MKEAIAWLEHAPQEVRLLQARRLSNYMADVVQAGLLIGGGGVGELAHKNSARKAIVARYFVATRRPTGRCASSTSADTTVLDCFEPIVRYQPVSPKALG